MHVGVILCCYARALSRLCCLRLHFIHLLKWWEHKSHYVFCLFAIYISLLNDPLNFDLTKERGNNVTKFSNGFGKNLNWRRCFNICFINIASGTNERNRGIGNQRVHHTTVYKYVLFIRHLDDMFLLCMHRGLDVLEENSVYLHILFRWYVFLYRVPHISI